MKVLFVLEAGIPEYRNFLFEKLSNEKEINDLLVLHNGRIYNGKGNYKSKIIPFIGNNKFGFYLGLLKYIRKYDVIVSSYNLRIISCWLPVFFKKKWIFWGKGLGNNESILINFIRKVTARKCASLLVYNEFKKKELVLKLKVDPDKVVGYNNTIFINNVSIIKEERKDYFLYFGRLQKRKGLLELIEEYKRYCEISSKPLKLRFVGNGDYRITLEKKAKELELLNQIEFYEGVYDDVSIKEHFVNAKAYISPYNVGLAVVNSFAYGIPVITCTKPQVGPEFHYLNDCNAYILDDISDLSNQLLYLEGVDSLVLGEQIQSYYNKNINSDVMYSHFYNTIKKTYNNE